MHTYFKIDFLQVDRVESDRIEQISIILVMIAPATAFNLTSS